MIRIVIAADEDEAAAQTGEGVIIIVPHEDYTGEGSGWCLVISTADMLDEVRPRLAGLKPLDVCEHQPPAISVLATPEQVEALLV